MMYIYIRLLFPVHTSQVCEHGKLDIACSNKRTLKIYDAVYGRMSGKICTNGPMPDLNCIAPDSLKVVRSKYVGTIYFKDKLVSILSFEGM